MWESCIGVKYRKSSRLLKLRDWVFKQVYYRYAKSLEPSTRKPQKSAQLAGKLLWLLLRWLKGIFTLRYPSTSAPLCMACKRTHTASRISRSSSYHAMTVSLDAPHQNCHEHFFSNHTSNTHPDSTLIFSGTKLAFCLCLWGWLSTGFCRASRTM